MTLYNVFRVVSNEAQGCVHGAQEAQEVEEAEAGEAGPYAGNAALHEAF